MINFLHLLLLIPLAGYLISLLFSSKKETALAWTAFITVGLQFFLTIILLFWWWLAGLPTFNVKDWALFQTLDYNFFLDFYFDKITAVYLLVGAVLSFLVTVYSRHYLHRENGYKRFFNTILFFFLGYNIVVTSGNMETLFIGWEILGISSFLLISFYRDRYLPVKNAVKVFSIYRIADVGLILAMWMSHHLWHENITFSQLNNHEIVSEHLQQHSINGFCIAILILISAAAKSAQLPFSSWLPRAMEGPTPSSAVFYGSMSVHIGIFILLRTFPFWENQISVRWIIAILGFSTSIIATGIARVQSSVKSQIAYASIAQIGLIFIEVALGFDNLALFHFAGNAFLRTYQLLISPSVVSYLIKEQFYNYAPKAPSIEAILPKKWQYTFYILCLKEWNLDTTMHNWLWMPLKRMGQYLNFLTVQKTIAFFSILMGAGIAAIVLGSYLPNWLHHSLPTAYSIIGLVLVLKSFTERKSVKLSWLLVMVNHCFIALAVSFNDAFSSTFIFMYLSGVFVAALVGYLCIARLKKLEKEVDLSRFHGHSYEHPKITFVFLLACLGLTGFPITPTFIGEDLIYTHIHEHQIILAIAVSLSLIVDGLAVMRIYARVFLGPHAKSYHDIAYRSS